MTSPQKLDALLRETRWLSGLAKQLVSRGEDAEDLVQETMRRACEHPPASGRSVRGWLRSIMVNRLRDLVRSERARSVRERAQLLPTDSPATIDIVAKAEVHRGLVSAVLLLDEPYRSCLLLRFFENLPPREIARQTGVSVATVHSRLQRALTKMRERLAETHGPRWPLAIAPLLRHNLVAPLLFGVSLVNLFAKISLGLAAIAVAFLCWDWSTEPSSTGRQLASSREPTPSAEASQIVATGAEPALERTLVLTPAPQGKTVADTPPPMLRGRVIDLYGVGIIGVSLSVGDSGDSHSVAPGLSSGVSGAFEFSAELSSAAGADTIVSSDPRWATVLAGSTRIRAPNLSTVVVAPGIELGGRVVNSDGDPLPRAAVQVHLPSHLGADLGILLDYSVNVNWEASCDQEGRFVLRDVPALPKGKLSVTLGGYLPQIVELPRQSTDSLELVLDRPEVGTAGIEGFVVDAFGAFVAGARVSAGGAVSRTDDHGAFTIDLSNGKTLNRIVAVAKGMQPAVLVPERDAADKPKWPARVMLRLGQAPLSITGQVIDRDHRPVEGAKVWIDDPMVVGYDGKSTLLAETFLGRGDGPFWAFVHTDSSGMFRLDGLLDRVYVVRALDPSTLMAVTKKGVQAGNGSVELQLASATYSELQGQVVGRDGSAISGVIVKLSRPALSVRIPGGPESSMFEWAVSTPVTTNQAGEFVFKNVPTEGVVVQATGDSILFSSKSVEPGIDPLVFVLQADRRMHLQVELTTPTDRADEVRVLDATGRYILLVLMRGTHNNQNFKVPLLDGRSEVLSLREGAQTAVFFKDGVEVGSVPVQLQAGQMNKIRF